MHLSHPQRGDTIIEVLFAVTIFSIVAVAGLSLMNQGSALAQRALEIGLVRQQIDAQADALRYLNRAYIADYGKGGAATTEWNAVVTAHAVDKAQRFDEIADTTNCRLPGSSDLPFALDITKLDANPLLAPSSSPATYAKVRYESTGANAEGIWIQAVRSATRIGSGDGKERPGFYDFHIRACWQTPGQSAPITLGTIVRLYEPRG
jgi:prepilin-type N-terminal cleavage/methylation domain-containing protein